MKNDRLLYSSGSGAEILGQDSNYKRLRLALQNLYWPQNLLGRAVNLDPRLCSALLQITEIRSRMIEIIGALLKQHAHQAPEPPGAVFS